MRNDIKRRNFITQGSILAVTGIICRLIGMLYRIPLVRIIGTVGNGYYTSAYSIYNILLILSSYSLPTAISKIISVRLAREKYNDIRKALRVAFIYATVMGGAMCFLMYYMSAPLAGFMEKPFCEYAIKTLAPTIWIMAYLGVLRGYFQGSGNMVPTAVSQLLEQVVNAVVSIVMAVMLFDYGVRADAIYHETQYSYAYGAAGGTIGTGAGALIALLFFVLLMLLFGRLPGDENVYRGGNISRRKGAGAKRSAALRGESYAKIAKVLFITLIPILISSTVYNISTVLDDMVFSRMMAWFGLGGSVVFLWGIFGEYRILFNIPVAISNSLSSSVIPSLSNAVAARDRELVARKIKISIKFVVLISMPAAVGLFVLAGPICSLLFYGNDNTLLIKVLRVGTPAVVLFSLSTITNGLLQGLGHLSEPLKNSFASLIIHMAVLIVLVIIMRDIYSVIIANTVFALSVCLLNNRCMHSHVRFRIDFLRTYILPLAAALIMGALVFAEYALLSGRLFAAGSSGLIREICSLLICICTAVPVYFVLLLFFKAFTKDELMDMPMGLRIYKMAHRAGLM